MSANTFFDGNSPVWKGFIKIQYVIKIPFSTKLKLIYQIYIVILETFDAHMYLHHLSNIFVLRQNKERFVLNCVECVGLMLTILTCIEYLFLHKRKVLPTLWIFNQLAKLERINVLEVFYFPKKYFIFEKKKKKKM